MSNPPELMSWDELGIGCRALARAIHDDGYRPDMVLAIARGGMLVAAALGYALGVKNTFTMNVEFYTGVDARLDMPMILPPVPDLVDFQETRVLIADDVADTGATIALVEEFCVDKVAEVRSAVLYEKPHEHGQVRVRVAPHRPLDHVPVERRAARRRRVRRLGRARGRRPRSVISRAPFSDRDDGEFRPGAEGSSSV